MMPRALKDLLRAFNDQGVKYLVVGGYAFGVHAEPRATKDIGDIRIRSVVKFAYGTSGYNSPWFDFRRGNG